MVDHLSVGMFDRRLSAHEWASLAGAPDGATVEITQSYDGHSVEINWEHSGIKAMRTIDKTQISNDSFFVAPGSQGGGSAVAMMTRQIATARKLGIGQLVTHAARLDPYPGIEPENVMVGYKVWPKFGYNGPIEHHIHRKLPKELQGAKTVRDLYRTKQGQAAWEQHGNDVHLVLDLRKGSPDLKHFRAYRAHKAAQAKK